MRIRQVRPEFFTDAVVSRLPTDVRLTYIGLWCVADDAGWMTWDVSQIGAQLYPYQSVHVRERRIEKAGEALRGVGRLTLEPCGCALIPHLVDHQRIGGNKSFTSRDKHRVHTSTDLSAGKVGKGKVSNGRVRAREKDEELTESFRRLGLPVDG